MTGVWYGKFKDVFLVCTDWDTGDSGDDCDICDTFFDGTEEEDVGSRKTWVSASSDKA